MAKAAEEKMPRRNYNVKSVLFSNSSHSLVWDLSRGFSITEHVESELLLLLPARKRDKLQEKPKGDRAHNRGMAKSHRVRFL